MSLQRRESNELPVITSLMLSSFTNIVCGISTRYGGVSNPPYGLNLSFKVGDVEEHVNRNRELFFGQLQIPLHKLAIPGQVHGNNVVRVHEPGLFEDCDGLVTNEKDIYLTISVADCLCVLLYDPIHQAIGAVHSGCKGSKQRILATAIRRMRNDFNSQPREIYAFLGQSAGVCCYEVGEEVAAQFDVKFVERVAGRKPHLNLKEFNRNLLLSEGVNYSNIEILSDCTICNPSKYHSFRRDGNVSGRMSGVIGLKSTIL